MGDQYMKKSQWDKAVDFFDETIEVAEKIGNKKIIGWGHFNKAQALAYLGELEKAEEEAQQAENILQKIDHKVGLSGVYRTKGIVAREKGDCEEALDMIQKGIDVIEGLNIPFNRYLCLFDLAKTYHKMGDMEKSKEYFRQAKNGFRGLGSDQYLKWTEEYLEKIEQE